MSPDELAALRALVEAQGNRIAAHAEAAEKALATKSLAPIRAVMGDMRTLAPLQAAIETYVRTVKS